MNKVVVEVTGGTYTDEATGTAAVPLTSTIRAIVSSAATGDKIAISPLTELAYQKAAGAGDGNLSPTIIDDANLKVGQTFGVDSIINRVTRHISLELINVESQFTGVASEQLSCRPSASTASSGRFLSIPPSPRRHPPRRMKRDMPRQSGLSR